MPHDKACFNVLLAFDDAIDEDDLDLIEENLGINLDRVGKITVFVFFFG